MFKPQRIPACIALFMFATLHGYAQEVPSEARLLPVAGSAVVVATWEAKSNPWYAVSLDSGASWATARQTSYDILLRYRNFDPLREGEPEVPRSLKATGQGQLYIVQYVTQGLQAYRDIVSSLGGEVTHFLAHHTNIVRMNPIVAAEISALPFVRWVGSYHPAYRIDSGVLAGLTGTGSPRRRYNIQCTHRGIADKVRVRDVIRALGGSVDPLIPDGFLLQAGLSEEQLLAVLHLDEVFFVDPWSLPEDDMDIVRNFSGANSLENATGYTGQGVRGEIFDGNILTTHEQWNGNAPLAHTSLSGSQSHGTPVYSIVFGTGNGNSSSRGMLPDAEQGIFADYGQYGGNRYAHTSQLLSSPYFAVFQTNSWGNSTVTGYTSISMEMDDILFLNDIVITQSQSNTGSQLSRPQAWAKNIVSCGGIRHQNTLTESDDSWNSGASIGPAEDGRIKPDLAHFYDSTLAASSSSDTSYSQFGGTSGATPIVAGHFGLFFQMWHEDVFQNNPTGATVFSSKPHATTARAVVINTATSWAFSGTSADLGRYKQGWGRPDVGRMYDLRDRMFIVDESDVLTNLQSTSYSVTVNPGEPELRATLVYLEPAGTTSSSQHRINDLSLKVTSPNATFYWGNNGLDASNVSSSGGVSNTIDPVENVRVLNPTPGVWTVEVIASEINQDNHTETPQVDADYALVVTGVTSSTSAAPQPNPMTFSVAPFGLTSNAVSMIASVATPTPVEYFYELVSNNSTGGDSSGWQSSPIYTDIGLTPSAFYSYTVRARNATTLVETSPSWAVAGFTLAATPGAPTLGNPTNEGFEILSLATSNNGGLTLYAVDVGGQWVQANGSLGAQAFWAADTSFANMVVSGLQPETAYDVKVKARNFIAQETAFGPSAQVTTDHLGDCAAGTLGVGLGGPFDVLKVNGSSGGSTRLVTAVVGSPILFEVDQPPTSSVSSNFIVLGWVGTPVALWEFPLPAGIGTLCFPPCDVNPSLPSFNLVSTYGPTACGEFFQGTGAPWSFAHPGVPFALHVTLQVVIEQSPGVLRTGNALVFKYQ